MFIFIGPIEKEEKAKEEPEKTGAMGLEELVEELFNGDDLMEEEEVCEDEEWLAEEEQLTEDVELDEELPIEKKSIKKRGRKTKSSESICNLCR